MQENGCDITTSELLQLQAQCESKVDDITFVTPDPSASPIVTPTEIPVSIILAYAFNCYMNSFSFVAYLRAIIPLYPYRLRDPLIHQQETR